MQAGLHWFVQFYYGLLSVDSTGVKSRNEILFQQEAASYEYVEVCKVLLKANAQPDMYGYDNRTALHEAVKADNIELASLLIEANASKKVFDNVGKKPMLVLIQIKVKSIKPFFTMRFKFAENIVRQKK